MATREPAHTEQGFERLVFFTDAVVAIAITLVVLPLVDSARDLKGESAAHFFAENADGLRAAAISFVVIAAFWRDHHATLEHATGFTQRLVTTNLFWIAGIVALPVATTIDVETPGSDRLAIACYLGTIAEIMIAARVGEFILVRRGLLPGQRVSRRFVIRSSVSAVLVLLALAVAMAFPTIGLLPALLLVLAHPLRLVVDRVVRED